MITSRNGIRSSDRSQVFQAKRAIAFQCTNLLFGAFASKSSKKMGYVRLRIRELADKRGWSLKDVADHSKVNYNTIRSYVQRGELNTVDLSAVYKIAKAFEVTIDDLVEVVE